MKMKKGIDVSSHNGKLNWELLKSQGVEFAIIRVGYGGDAESQDDKYAEYNMSECERLDIPYGVYLYSYALAYEGATSEANHTLRVIKGHNPTIGVFYDMEDADGYKSKNGLNPYSNGGKLTEFCKIFCKAIEAAGYKAGVYANLDYFRNVLDKSSLSDWIIWLAQWGPSKPSMECDIWQYSSDGSFSGVSGRFDVNYLYTYVETESTPETVPVGDKTIDELAQEVIEGKWGNDEDRKNRLTAAGYDYYAVQNRVNEMFMDAPVVHTIKKGETLTSIANDYGTTVEALAKLNNIENIHLIYAGDKLKIR